MAEQVAVRGQAAREFLETSYRTLTSWSCARRVVGKAEVTTLGSNPRFVVTSLSVQAWDARALYEDLYCARGEMENRIKEAQLELFADRTSTHLVRANQLKVALSSACPWQEEFLTAFESVSVADVKPPPRTRVR